jgi:inhibitor of cysteine peptidase
MKKFFLLTLAGMIGLLLLSGCGNKTVKVDDSMNGQTITVKAGEVIEVSLAGNPTTGYNWYAVNLDETILTQSGEADFKSDSSAIGSGGIITNSFKAEAAGTTTLTLEYKRSWEEGVEPIQVFTITVVVE